MNIYLVILAVVLAAIVPLALIMGCLSVRDKRMEMAKKAWLATRMRKAEEGHMEALDRAQWMAELKDRALWGEDEVANEQDQD